MRGGSLVRGWSRGRVACDPCGPLSTCVFFFPESDEQLSESDAERWWSREQGGLRDGVPPRC
jgi:hypothetical protein